MIIALILFLFPLAYSPGPGNLFFAAIGGRFGVRASLPASLGYHIATFIVTLAIGFGFGEVAEFSPKIFTFIKWLGGAYVLYLALRIFFAGRLDAEGHAKPAGFASGFMLLILNPKAYVIIALMFTQFLNPQSTAKDVLFISAIFTLNNFIAFLIWTWLGDKIADLFRGQASAKWLNRGFGVLLAVVAIWMLLI